MGRPKGTKNNMKTPKEKEKLILEWQLSGMKVIDFVNNKKISESAFRKWRRKYKKGGISGLKRETGKVINPEKAKNKGIYLRKPKTREEELELQVIKLQIENERLKKGYTVKGDGAKKEYVSTLEKNTK
jgi:transposase-like protein